MLHRSRFLVASLGCAAVTAACAHHAPGAKSGAPDGPPGHALHVPSRTADGAAAAVPPHPLANAGDGASVILAELDGKTLAYVADEDDGLVRVIDVDEGEEISSLRLGAAPAQLVMRKDGRLLVTLRDVSEIAVLGGSASKLVVERRASVAAEPVGLALSPDEATLVVTSGWGKTVSVLDASTLEKRAEHAVAREPRSVLVSSDGKRAFVSHAVGSSIDVIPLQPGGAPHKPIGTNGVEQVFTRMAGNVEQSRSACQGFALARAESGRIFAPHVLVFTGEPEQTSDGYGGGGEGRNAEVFHVPVIDEQGARVVPSSMRLTAGLSGDTSRCSLPRAARVGKAGLFVTCLGDDSVMLYDADAVNPHEVELGRWVVPSGPVGIALDETHARAIVWSQFAHALTSVAIGEGQDTPRPFALSSVTFPRHTHLSAKVERGRQLFHATGETRISADGRACASCHPDGRDDALVWSSPNGPRQTPILAGRLSGAAPYGWNGDAKDVSTHLVQTFKRLGGSGLTGDDKEALMAYVASLRVPPPKAPKDPSAVARGMALFQSPATECSTCHGEQGDLPDGTTHDVKSRVAGDTKAKFDTPSLRLVGGSAPYFHDGRYKDLRTLLTKSDGKMGHTKHLSTSELADLEAYLESL